MDTTKKTTKLLSQAAQYYTYNPVFSQSPASTQSDELEINEPAPTGVMSLLTDTQLLTDEINHPLLDRRTRQALEESCYKLYVDKNYDAALKEITLLLRDAPRERDLLKLRADINIALNNAPQALIDLNIILNEKLDDEEALNKRSSILYEQGNYEGALADIRHAFNLSRSVQYGIYTDAILECLTRKSHILYLRNQTSEALDIINDILKHKNGYAPALALQKKISPAETDIRPPTHKRTFFDTPQKTNKRPKILATVTPEKAGEEEEFSLLNYMG